MILNQIAVDFSKLLGAYVGCFALASVLAGRLFFEEAIAPSAWLGLAIILVGSSII